MAQLSLGECRWRMLRRVLGKKRFRYDDCRNMSRHDQVHFDWLVAHGFLSELGDGWYSLTAKGKESSDLGFYEV